MSLWKHRAIGLVVFMAMVAVPVGISLATESPGGTPHTTEWHGRYEGCKWTNGWARRTWNLMDKTLPGPGKDPNYSYPGKNGKVYDFRCEKPKTRTQTVTATATVTAPGGTVTIPGPTVTLPGSTSTVTVPGPTVTETATATSTVTVTTTPPPPLPDICHAADGGYVLISPSNQGVLNGHLDHEDDIIPAPAEGCPEDLS